MKEHTWYALTGKWILGQKLGILKIQFRDHMKFKKEDQTVDTFVLLRRRVKYPWLTVNQRTKHRFPTGGARERTPGAEEVCSPIGGTISCTSQ